MPTITTMATKTGMSTKPLTDKKRVVVGMSGGVDSTVAALLLKQQGYDVIGVTMKTWDDPSEDYAERLGGCCSLSSVEDARRAADRLGIPFYVLNFKAPFKEHVIDYFVAEYEDGRTPNPCIACNKHIKFDLLLRKAHELGAEYVATGHYARIEQDEATGRWLMRRSLEPSKDQTYMLYNMTQYQLAHTLMPLGAFSSKEEVRKLAEGLDVAIASKPDSQEICFIPDDDYIRFLNETMTKPPKQGFFVDKQGKRIAPHQGIIHYTVGQRKGLGVALGKPAYVVQVNGKTGDVVLGDAEDVFGTKLTVEQVNWIAVDHLTNPIRLSVKIRHTTHEAMAWVRPGENGTVTVEFDEPQRAITPGQGIVFYLEDLVFGGGIIKSAE